MRCRVRVAVALSMPLVLDISLRLPPREARRANTTRSAASSVVFAAQILRVFREIRDWFSLCVSVKSVPLWLSYRTRASAPPIGSLQAYEKRSGLIRGLRSSDSSTRALARRFDGALRFRLR